MGVGFMARRRKRAALDADRLTVREVAAYLSISHDTVLRLIDDGELPAVDVSAKDGRRNLRIAKADVEAFLTRRGTQ